MAYNLSIPANVFWASYAAWGVMELWILSRDSRGFRGRTADRGTSCPQSSSSRPSTSALVCARISPAACAARHEAQQQNGCGQPGALPVPNRQALEHMVRAGLAFDSEIPEFSKFNRKNYFYPDMPKDYQISQFDMPITQGGVVRYWLEDGTMKECRLTRIHLEEDTGKSTHAGSGDRHSQAGSAPPSPCDLGRRGG